MLDAKDLDAVIVATPDHTHAPIAIDVMESGRDLYVQKPMTRRLDDAFRMLDTAKRTGRSVQVGTQGCTRPQVQQRARGDRASGALGRVLWAQASYCRQNPKGEWNYEIDPEPRPQTPSTGRPGSARPPSAPFSPERYFRWRKYWDYGTGVIGDLLPHRLGPALMAMGVEEYPRERLLHGRQPGRNRPRPGPDGKPYGERRDVGDTHLVTVAVPLRRDAVRGQQHVERARRRGPHPRPEGEPPDGRRQARARARAPVTATRSSARRRTCPSPRRSTPSTS